MSIITTQFNVNGMSCGHCEKAIKGALNDLHGVANTEVDLNAKTVTVQYDEDLLTEQNLTEAIEEAGYDVE